LIFSAIKYKHFPKIENSLNYYRKSPLFWPKFWSSVNLEPTGLCAKVLKNDVLKNGVPKILFLGTFGTIITCVCIVGVPFAFVYYLKMLYFNDTRSKDCDMTGKEKVRKKIFFFSFLRNFAKNLNLDENFSFFL